MQSPIRRESAGAGERAGGPATVVFVAHDTGFIGGAERQLLELFIGLDTRRFRAVLVCLEPGGPVARRASEIGVAVRHILRTWRWDLTVALRLRDLIKQERAEIVHGYLGLPGLYGAIAGKLAGARVIATIRIAGPRPKLSEASERLAFLLADSIIANSRAGADYYFRRFPGRGKTSIIYNGYALGDFSGGPARSRAELGLPERGPLVGHVANLTFLKDYPTFLAALARVFAERSDASGVIVGGGGKRSDYEEIARSLGIGDRTVFLGARGDVLELVRHFDVCVLASHGRYSEGLSNSIAEYMGLGKPVVATAVGGNLELVREGLTGYLTPPGEPEPLARRIVELLARPELRQAMGAGGRKFFEENLTLENMVAGTQKVYERLLEEANT